MCQNYFPFTNTLEEASKIRRGLGTATSRGCPLGKNQQDLGQPYTGKIIGTDFDGQCDDTYKQRTKPYPLQGEVITTAQGSRQNPGPAGAGIITYGIEARYHFQYETEIYTNSIWLSKKHTNNTAEFVAVIAGMSAAKAMGIEFFSAGRGLQKMTVVLMNGKTTPRATHIVALYFKPRNWRMISLGLEYYTLAEQKTSVQIVWRMRP